MVQRWPDKVRRDGDSLDPLIPIHSFRGGENTDRNSVALPSALLPLTLLPAKKTLSRSLETDQPCPALGVLSQRERPSGVLTASQTTKI